MIRRATIPGIVPGDYSIIRQIMAGTPNSSPVHTKIASKLKPAFAALLEAFDYATETGSDLWEFGVAIRDVLKLGLSESDLRLLVRKGYAEHAREITRLEDDVREFRHTANSSFCKRTCFVLTVDGAEHARSLGNHNDTSIISPRDSKNQLETQETESRPTPDVPPVWDAERRELRVDGELVKQFKWSAANQETILATFEEEHWPVRIDDPLPPHEEQDSKRRLSDTIKCLNRKQKHPLIHFRGDGTGEGVIWERVEPRDQTNSDARALKL